MPFLSLVHLKSSVCIHCGAELASAGARSFVVDAQGAPINFSETDPPAVMRIEIACPQGHVTDMAVPLEIGAEESLITPEEAPIACDAVLAGGTAESGAELL
ncbi:MAG: hypothetical protein M3M96_04850 [Candidatus Eremiobacteraeota bacterium]|nr:hypothetical protein [Candidatus Eremiobacteraeota bacterium]